MADKKTSIKLQFAPLDPVQDDRGKTRKQSPVVEINNGDYSRIFEAKDQPFECVGLTRQVEGGQDVVLMTPEEEARLLLNSGHFVPAGEDKAAESAPADEASASATASKKSAKAK